LAEVAALKALPCDKIAIWYNGSTSNRVTNGGGEEDIWVAANFLTSSYRAELVAIRAALKRTLLEGSIAHFTDSRTALQVLHNGTAEQFTLLGTEVWDLLEHFSVAGHPVQLQ
jgi:hypothetical protein